MWFVVNGNNSSNSDFDYYCYYHVYINSFLVCVFQKELDDALYNRLSPTKEYVRIGSDSCYVVDDDGAEHPLNQGNDGIYNKTLKKASYAMTQLDGIERMTPEEKEKEIKALLSVRLEDRSFSMRECFLELLRRGLREPQFEKVLQAIENAIDREGPHKEKVYLSRWVGPEPTRFLVYHGYRIVQICTEYVVMAFALLGVTGDDKFLNVRLGECVIVAIRNDPTISTILAIIITNANIRMVCLFDIIYHFPHIPIHSLTNRISISVLLSMSSRN